MTKRHNLWFNRGMTEGNPHEDAARAYKVIKLVHALALAGVGPDTIAVLDDPAIRADAERVAGVRPASAATWQLVRDELMRLPVPKPLT